jgi:hypothetical protein
MDAIAVWGFSTIKTPALKPGKFGACNGTAEAVPYKPVKIMHWLFVTARIRKPEENLHA